MRFNIFEGARRIATVTQFCIGTCCVVMMFARWPDSTDERSIAAHLGDIGSFLIVGLLSVSITTWVVGWIIRGALGIQQGSDFPAQALPPSRQELPNPIIPSPADTALITKLDRIDAWCMETNNILRYGDDIDSTPLPRIYTELAALRQDISSVRVLLKFGEKPSG